MEWIAQNMSNLLRNQYVNKLFLIFFWLTMIFNNSEDSKEDQIVWATFPRSAYFAGLLGSQVRCPGFGVLWVPASAGLSSCPGRARPQRSPLRSLCRLSSPGPTVPPASPGRCHRAAFTRREGKPHPSIPPRRTTGAELWSFPNPTVKKCEVSRCSKRIFSGRWSHPPSPKSSGFKVWGGPGADCFDSRLFDQLLSQLLSQFCSCAPPKHSLVGNCSVACLAARHQTWLSSIWWSSTGGQLPVITDWRITLCCFSQNQSNFPCLLSNFSRFKFEQN